tara:strand:+ start:656 stop:1141 length:486 start_codon:yes stop_codon:yes gene_type:complete
MKSKKIILDKSGKSNALFFKNNMNVFDKKIINFLENHYKKKKTELRFCLHKSKSTNLQVMINLIVKKDKYQLHYHNFSDEYYFPIKGNLKLLTFDKKNKFINSFKVDKKKGFLGKIIKGQTHIAVPLKNFCIYLEFRSGNFTQHKNVFSKKFVNYKEALKL